VNVVFGLGGMFNQANKDKFIERLDYLFDIASCKHEIQFCEDSGCQGCQDGVHIDCCCSREKKIPKLELAFFKAMREHRPEGTKAGMMMAGKDKAECLRQDAAEERKAKEDSAKKMKENKEKEKETELEERSQLEQLLREDAGGSEGGQLDELVKRPQPGLCDYSSDEDSEDEDWEPQDEGARRLKRNYMPIPNTALAAVRLT
jgi:hypothetical protein